MARAVSRRYGPDAYERYTEIQYALGMGRKILMVGWGRLRFLRKRYEFSNMPRTTPECRL